MPGCLRADSRRCPRAHCQVASACCCPRRHCGGEAVGPTRSRAAALCGQYGRAPRLVALAHPRRGTSLRPVPCLAVCPGCHGTLMWSPPAAHKPPLEARSRLSGPVRQMLRQQGHRMRLARRSAPRPHASQGGAQRSRSKRWTTCSVGLVLACCDQHHRTPCRVRHQEVSAAHPGVGWLRHRRGHRLAMTHLTVRHTLALRSRRCHLTRLR